MGGQVYLPGEFPPWKRPKARADITAITSAPAPGCRGGNRIAQIKIANLAHKQIAGRQIKCSPDHI
jgi:hypothetical protein